MVDWNEAYALATTIVTRYLKSKGKRLPYDDLQDLIGDVVAKAMDYNIRKGVEPCGKLSTFIRTYGLLPIILNKQRIYNDQHIEYVDEFFDEEDINNNEQQDIFTE